MADSTQLPAVPGNAATGGQQAADMAERVVLGALIDDGEQFRSIALPVLSEESFTDPACQVVFGAIDALARTGEDINLPAVTLALGDAGQLTAAGGAGAVASLVTDAATVRNPRVHLQRLIDSADTRQVHDAMRHLLGVRAHASTVFERLEKLRSDRPDMSVTLPTLAEQMGAYHDELHRRREMSTPLVGIPTGWRDLDGEYRPGSSEATRVGYLPGGFERGHLVLIAARPGVGKTSAVVDFIRSACKAGHGVVFFSNEMPAQEIIETLVCAEVGTINRGRYKWPKDFTAHQWDRIAEVQADIADNWHLIIDDQADSLDDQRRVLAAARQTFRDAGCELDIMFQDFIQRMRTKGGRGQMAQHEELGTFSAGLKDMAKQMNIAVVAAAQLNRGSIETDRLPRADDLRGSGSLEQDADVIMALHRPYATGGQDTGHAATDLKVAMLKVRHGASGQVFDRTFVGELAQTREPGPRILGQF